MTGDNRARESFKQAVRKNFAFLKQTTQLDGLFAKSIPLAGNMSYLLPVCELHTGDDALIALLAKWRDENTFAYPSQFPVTIAGTASTDLIMHDTLWVGVYPGMTEQMISYMVQTIRDSVGRAGK